MFFPTKAVSIASTDEPDIALLLNPELLPDDKFVWAVTPEYTEVIKKVAMANFSKLFLSVFIISELKNCSHPLLLAPLRLLTVKNGLCV